jgi:adenine C2-methylase RlmN of 23S rRNA A2503 and tRNA A37
MTGRALHSAIDESVNFVSGLADGMIESRYVRRGPEYFIVYLSSHTGCTKACRFCHLTATRQTGFTPASPESMAAQARQVFAHYDAMVADRERTGQEKAERVNFNWMARGEPLANPHVRNGFANIRELLEPMAEKRDLTPVYNVSTIMPEEVEGLRLADLFGHEPVTLYYSLYSMRRAFRRRWMPKALAPETALDMLADYQVRTGREVVFHWAFIESENDDEETVREIAEAITSRGLRGKFNLVRYNPYSPAQGREPAEEILERNFAILAEALGHPESRIVPRVGFDVRASCGMFVHPSELPAANDHDDPDNQDRLSA